MNLIFLNYYSFQRLPKIQNIVLQVKPRYCIQAFISQDAEFDKCRLLNLQTMKTERVFSKVDSYSVETGQGDN